jgi:hypothetical protein
MVTILFLILYLCIEMNFKQDGMSKEAIFISSSVVRTDNLISNLPKGAEIVYLSDRKSEIAQITEYLSIKKKIKAIRIISHGNGGFFELGREKVDNNYIKENRETFKKWGKALLPDADIMLYGCNVASSEAGKALVQNLSELTGADVAAATKEVGGLLANWELDYRQGDIETSVLNIPDYEYHLATITVTSNADSGAGTLRQAIADAAGLDNIVFNLAAGKETITLTSELIINPKSNMFFIDGDNAAGSGTNITVSGNNNSRVFNITGRVMLKRMNIINGNIVGNGAGINIGIGTVVVIHQCNITNCHASGSSALGGAIYCNAGDLTIAYSTISDCNSRYYGGGISARNSHVYILKSTIFNNIAFWSGGGLHTFGGNCEISNSTIAYNENTYGSGGIFSENTVLQITNSTIFGNCNEDIENLGGLYYEEGTILIENSIIAYNGYADLAGWGTFTDQGYNIIRTSGLSAVEAGFSATSILYNTCFGSSGESFTSWSRGGTELSNQNLNISSSLADNGGATQTLAISKGSFAIAAGVYLTGDNATDQRDIVRHSLPTIGAYEPTYSVWSGTTDTDWGTTSNWESSTSPTSDYDVFIPDVTNDPVAGSSGLLCNNLNVLANGSLSISETATLSVSGDLSITSGGEFKIESNATGTGSLIINGKSSVSGTASAERYMTGNAWHVVSPTFSGGSISTFIQEANNSIPVNGSSYGMMDYVESTNTWDSYYTAATIETLDKGKGYCLRRTSDGVVTFTGSINSGTQNVDISSSGEGWNCIGNPYPSAIKMSNRDNPDDYNFLKENAVNNARLDASYACAYVWDPTSSTYKILGNSSYGERALGQNYLQSGQGFLVKSATGGATLSFTAAMQTHQPATSFKSAEVEWPGFELIAEINGKRSSATVTFNERMTRGLDVTYDAGLLRGSSGVDIYTRLVEDNGVEFAIQCLPDDFESLIIPLGIESAFSGEMQLSAKFEGMPSEWSVILEDRQRATMTDLEEGLSLLIESEEGAKITDRFYIHINNKESNSGETTSSGEIKKQVFRAYYSEGLIYLSGDTVEGKTAGISDLAGRRIGEYKLSAGDLNSIPAGNLKPGVYIVSVSGGDSRRVCKVVVNQ